MSGGVKQGTKFRERENMLHILTPGVKVRYIIYIWRKPLVAWHLSGT